MNGVTAGKRRYSRRGKALLWSDCAPLFHNYLITRGRRQSTVKTYLANVRLFAKFCEEREASLVGAPTYLLEAWIATSLQNVAHNTVALRLTCLRAFYEFCRYRHYRDDDPTVGLEVRWEEPEPRRPLSHDELDQLIAACRNPRDRMMITLAYDCGLRVHEVVGITQEQIDFEKGMIFFRGKGGRIGWTFPSSDVLEQLRPFCENPDGLLWVTKDGRPLTVKRAQRNMEEIAKRAGLHIHWHQLRTSFANAAIEGGVLIEDLRVLMRHRDIKTTQHYAGYTIQKRAQIAMRKLNLGSRLLGS